MNESWSWNVKKSAETWVKFNNNWTTCCFFYKEKQLISLLTVIACSNKPVSCLKYALLFLVNDTCYLLMKNRYLNLAIAIDLNWSNFLKFFIFDLRKCFESGNSFCFLLIQLSWFISVRHWNKITINKISMHFIACSSLL